MLHAVYGFGVVVSLLNPFIYILWEVLICILYLLLTQPSELNQGLERLYGPVGRSSMKRSLGKKVLSVETQGDMPGKSKHCYLLPILCESPTESSIVLILGDLFVLEHF